MNYTPGPSGLKQDSHTGAARPGPSAHHPVGHPESVRPPFANGPELVEGAQDKLREGPLYLH